MNIKIVGKDLTATEAIKEYAEKKLERIQKYFEGEDITANVTIKGTKNAQVAEMNVNVKSYNLRAVTETKDLYASIDKDIDIYLLSAPTKLYSIYFDISSNILLSVIICPFLVTFCEQSKESNKASP